MPSNIDFSQFRPDPEAFDKGQDWVNRLYQYAAKRDAGALYAAGDTVGAAKRLAVSGDIASASKLQNDEQDQQFARIKNSHDYITKQAAPLLSAIYAQHPEGLLPAFEQTVPEWKQAGATDAGVEQLRNAFKQNPKGTLEKLGGLGDVDVQKDGADTVGLRKNTGEIVWRVKGAPKPPETVTYQEGKEKVTDFYENGVKTKTVRGPISEPLIATGTAGILTPRSDAAGQQVYIKPTAANNPAKTQETIIELAGRQASTLDGLNDEYLQSKVAMDTLKEIADSGLKNPFLDLALATGEANDIRAARDAIKKMAVDQKTRFQAEAAQGRVETTTAAAGERNAATISAGLQRADADREQRQSQFNDRMALEQRKGNIPMFDAANNKAFFINPNTQQAVDMQGRPFTPSDNVVPLAEALKAQAAQSGAGVDGKTRLERDRNFVLTEDPSTAEYASRYATLAQPQVTWDNQTGDRIVSTPDMSWARVPTFRGAATGAGGAPGPARGAATGQPTVTAEPGRAASPARATFEANVNQATEDTALAISRFFKGGPKGQEEKGVFQRSIAATGNIPLTNGRTASQAIRRAVEVLLRLRTGAAAPEQEVDRYTYDFSPSIFDTDEGARIKMQRMRAFFADMRRIGESNIRAGTWGTDKASLTGANTGGGTDAAPVGSGSGGLSPEEQRELEQLRKEVGR